MRRQHTADLVVMGAGIVGAGIALELAQAGRDVVVNRKPRPGQIMVCLIDAVERGADHDAEPVTWHATRTELDVSLAYYSRKRQHNDDWRHSVLG